MNWSTECPWWILAGSWVYLCHIAFLNCFPWPPAWLSVDYYYYCYYFILLRKMLGYGPEQISDLVKSQLPKLEIPEYFNSSGWPLNEMPPLVINMSLSTFMIFRNIICHSFYLHRASFKLLKNVSYLFTTANNYTSRTGCSENQLWKTWPGAGAGTPEWCWLLWVVDVWNLAMELPLL